VAARFVAPAFTFAVAAAAWAVGVAGGCAKDPVYAWRADAGTGGAMGAGGSGVLACDPTRGGLGRVDRPARLISVGKPVAASSGVTNPMKVVDGVYAHAGAFLPAPTAQSPAWLAINVGAGPARLLLTWADIGWNDYNTPVPGGSPASYRIETSGDSTDGVDGRWDRAVDVPINTVRERAHTFAFAGQAWVKVVVTAAANGSGSAVGVSIDEIGVYDVTPAVPPVGDAARPTDTWFFMGDSLTAGAFRRQLGVGTSFDALIQARRPAFSPVVLNGGIGGELSTNGLAHVSEWLALNPDILHIAILYGTNDSWGVSTAASANLQTFTSNMTAMVDMMIVDGRVPIVARIPYATKAHDMLAPFNAAIDALSASRGLPCGPDLYQWFKDHPEELSDDGVHPSDIGYRSVNKLWADAMLGRYPAP
jgi:lysophospholipase L1-like esterase